MAKIEIIPLFPPAESVDLNGEFDHDPPVTEPVEIHILKNARVNYYGYVFQKGQVYEYFVSPRHRGTISLKNRISNYLTKKVVRVDSPVISVAHGWYDNYYHFTLEVLVKIFLLSTHFPDTTILFPSKVSKFHSEWFELLGLKNLRFMEENEVILSPKVISCNFPNRDLNHHHLITPLFREWILDKAKTAPGFGNSSPAPFLFINREKAAKRRLINQQEVIGVLTERNFRITNLEDHSVLEQISLFQQAREIVSVHGASLTNTLFCEPGTKIVDLIHQDYPVNCFYKLSSILGLDYSKLLCKGGDDSLLPGYRDLEADCSQLTRMV